MAEDKNNIKKRIIQSIEENKNKIEEKIAEDNPHYPVKVLTDVMTNNYNSKKVISILEEVRTQNEFNVLVRIKNTKNYEVSLGNAGPFSLWRDLLHLTLAREYYRNQDWKLAEKYYTMISDQSKFKYLSLIELAWTYVQTDSHKKLYNTLTQLEIQPQPFNHELINEGRLLWGHYFNYKKEYERVFTTADKYHFEQESPLEAIRKKLIAQTQFAHFLKNSALYGFNKKTAVLSKIISNLDSLPDQYKDAKTAFIASEAYWHMASAYRVEEPVKFKKQWTTNLAIAEKWLAPYVEKSMKEKKPFLDEEAHFFSIAVLWEQKKYNKAIERLETMPDIFPQGIYKADIYQLLGDHYFENKIFDKAVVKYRKLASVGTPSKAAYGVYKAAWCFYNMKEKWKALRHFERLISHYKDSKTKQGPREAALWKESRQDFLLVSSDLMKSKDAINEIKHFKFKNTDELEYIYELAKTYSKTGKFKESEDTYIYLLKEYPQNPKSLEWLSSLGKTYLAHAKREKIADIVHEYIPTIRKRMPASLYKKKEQGFINDWEKLVLIIHKEARKTNDDKINIAVDKSYKYFEKYFSSKTKSKLWYYGAQRLENKQQTWKAIGWYKNASQIKDFDLSKDAYHSVLTLLHQKNDNLSLKWSEETDLKKKNSLKKEYRKIAKTSTWYINQNPKENNWLIASSIRNESLYYSDQKKNLLTTAINDVKKDLKNGISLYFENNLRFYKNNDWKFAYEMANEIQSHIPKDYQFISLKDKKYNPLKKIQHFIHESAFKMARIFEDKKDIKLTRKWYSRVIEAKGPNELKLKAFHNSTLLLTKSESIEDLISWEKKLIKLEDASKSLSKMNGTEMSLMFQIYTHLSSLYKKKNLDYQEAKYLTKASVFSNDDYKRNEYLWDAAIIFASYHDWKSYKENYDQLKKNKAEVLTEVPSLLIHLKTIAYTNQKDLLWKKFQGASLKSLSADKKIILSHLFYQYFKNETPRGLKNKIKNYLTTHLEEMKKDDLFFPIPGMLEEEKFITRSENYIGQLNRRSIASIQTYDSVEESQKELKRRVGLFQKYMKSMKDQKDELKKFIRKSYPIESSFGVCQAPLSTEKTIESIESLTSQKLNSPQWNTFVKKMNEKVKQLQTLRSNEKMACTRVKDNIKFIPMSKNLKDVCFTSYCQKTAKREDILKYENSHVKMKPIEKIIHLVDMNAFGRAEYYLSELKDKDYQHLVFGLMRLKVGDTWNGERIFRLIKNQNIKKRAEVFLKKVNTSAQFAYLD
jgi:TolA-binding protein